MTEYEQNRREALAVQSAADLLYSESDLIPVYDRLAAEITETLADSNPVIVSVMLGAIVPTAEIIKRLGFPFEMDYLHATRYQGETAGGELIWKVSPGYPLKDRDVLVIDDILDEGPTLAAILESIKAQGPNRVLTAVLVQKMHDRRPAHIKPDFVGVEAEDRYLFGCGMDYKGYLRQLPAIYAVKNS